MWRVTIKYLAARKLRLLLTGIAVTLGVAFMAGTLTLTDTVQRTFDDLFANVNRGTDAVVRSKAALKSSQFGDSRPPVPESLLGQVRAVPGVAAAEGNVNVPYAQLVDSKGKAIGNPGQGAPSFGFVWSNNSKLNPFRLQPGSNPPRSDDQIVIDKKSADKGHLHVGQRTIVLSQQPSKKYTIVGIAKFGTVDSPAGASVVLYTTREAQRAAALPGKFTDISVVAAQGLSQDQVKTNLQRALSSDPKIEVITGKQLTKENQDNIKKALGFFRTALLVFAAVSLLVGIFIIYNTFSIIVAQRSREMALLRAVGASRRQVLTSIVGESFAIGLIASAIGLVLGIALSTGLKQLLNVLGFDIPGGSVVVKPATVIISMLIGTIVTLLSAVLPARRAATIPPIAAMREVSFETTGHSARRSLIGALIVGVGAAILAFGLFTSPKNAISYVGFGALLVFIGVFVLGPVIAQPAARILGAPLPRLKGMTGVLARENAIRSPKRTARTAAALMIGVALVGFITIFAASAKKSFAAAITDQIKVDYIITTGRNFGGSGLSPALAERIAKLPAIEAVTPIRIGPASVNGTVTGVAAVKPTAAATMFDFNFTRGSIASLTSNGVAVSKSYADKHHLSLGNPLPVKFSSGRTVPLKVEGIYKRTELAGTFLVSLDNYAKNESQQFQLDFQVFAKLKPGVSAAEGSKEITPLLKDYPTAKLQDQAQYKNEQVSSINQVLNLVYALLFLAILIALIGIANTLALSIYERTRELGLLRAVGMTRSQVRSSVRWEAAIIALFGTVLGLAIALSFGFSVFLALKNEGFSKFSAAPGQLLVIVILSAIAGVVAAIFPARRAAKLDILKAIATE
jgi:putative ABC transport system permease protein